MRSLILIALTAVCLTGPARAQDQTALMRGLENVLIARAINAACKNLPPNVHVSLLKQETSFIQAAQVPAETLQTMRSNVDALVKGQPCDSAFVVGYREKIVSGYALRNTVSALALHGKCNLFEQKVINALNDEMIGNARRSNIAPALLQIMQRQATENVGNANCNDAAVQQVKAQVIAAFDGPQTVLPRAERERQEFGMLLAAQEGNRKCRFLTPSQAGTVDQEVRKRAQRHEIGIEKIAQIRQRISTQISRQQCTGPQLTTVKRWVACGFKAC